MRGLAHDHDELRDEVERSIGAGRHPRRAFLVAHRGAKDQWLVTREHLAGFLERRRPPAVRVGYDLTLTTEKSLGVLALLGDAPSRDAVLDSLPAGNAWRLGRLDEQVADARIERTRAQRAR